MATTTVQITSALNSLIGNHAKAQFNAAIIKGRKGAFSLSVDEAHVPALVGYIESLRDSKSATRSDKSSLGRFIASFKRGSKPAHIDNATTTNTKEEDTVKKNAKTTKTTKTAKSKKNGKQAKAAKPKREKKEKLSAAERHARIVEGARKSGLMKGDCKRRGGKHPEKFYSEMGRLGGLSHLGLEDGEVCALAAPIVIELLKLEDGKAAIRLKKAGKKVRVFAQKTKAEALVEKLPAVAKATENGWHREALTAFLARMKSAVA